MKMPFAPRRLLLRARPLAVALALSACGADDALLGPDAPQGIDGVGADGRFRVGLEPGAYRLRPESGDPLPAAGEQEVTLPAGVWVEVTVSFDTGIR